MSKLLKLCSKLILILFFIILIIILLFISILFYNGPWNTKQVHKNLQKNPMEIIVSLTTTPYRINSIKEVLDSIFKQSILPNKVYVNVPWKFKRNNQDYFIPAWLKSYPNIIINRTQDYGPATKLIATLEKEHNPEAIIITLDDDRIYPKHVVRDLVKQYLPIKGRANHKANSALTGAGYMVMFGFNNQTLLQELVVGDRPSVIVAGFNGVAYKRKFFKNDIFNLVANLPVTCFLGDDLMISAYLLVHKIPIVKISSITYNPISSRLLFKTLDIGFTPDSLSLGAAGIGGGNEYNYAHCLSVLPKYGKADYQKAILDRTRIVYSSFYEEIDRTAFRVWFYKIVDKCLDLFGFLSNIIKKFLV